MAKHETFADALGPGTFVDTEFIGVPEDSRRLLRHIASLTPGLLESEAELDEVDFHGQDLPLIPGPLKSQVMVCLCPMRCILARP